MQHDYYHVLGVSTNATKEDIRAAYRKLAQRKHPDRGGTHEAMTQLNEAYFVLSQDERRAKYDQVRHEHKMNEGIEGLPYYWEATNAGQQAKAEAENYPRDWHQFNRWMDSLVGDIKKSKYGVAHFWIIPIPHTGDSVSGLICIAIGAVIFTGVAFLFNWYGLPAYLRMQGWGFASNGMYILAMYISPTVVGAFAGQVVHMSARAAIDHKEKAKAQSQSPSSKVIVCSQCGQKLRVPQMTQQIQITCPKCKASVTLSETALSQQTSSGGLTMSIAMFRVLLAVSIILIITAVFVDFATVQTLPPLLQLHANGWEVVQQYNNVITNPETNLVLHVQKYDQETSLLQSIGMLLVLAGLLAIIAAIVGLFLIKAWGAWLMLSLNASFLLLNPLLEPSVASNVANVLYELGDVLLIVLLTAIFIGPMRPHFFSNQANQVNQM